MQRCCGNRRRDGPNGSGKTTLFNSIVGFHPIDGGSIRFEGSEISRLRVPEIARLGLIRTIQQTRVYRAMSCVDNMLISTPRAHGGVRAMFARHLQRSEGKTIVMVERNARKGLEFADIGYVLVSGQLARAAPGKELFADPEVGKLFLGG